MAKDLQCLVMYQKYIVISVHRHQLLYSEIKALLLTQKGNNDSH